LSFFWSTAETRGTHIGDSSSSLPPPTGVVRVRAMEDMMNVCRAKATFGAVTPGT